MSNTATTTRTNYIYRHPAAHNGPAILAQRAELSRRLAVIRQLNKDGGR